MARMKLFEIWEDDAGPMLIPADGGWHTVPALKHWLEKEFRFVAAFEAASWKRAKEAFEAIMGWT